MVLQICEQAAEAHKTPKTCEQAAEAHKSKGITHSSRRSKMISDPSQIAKSSVDAMLSSTISASSSKCSFGRLARLPPRSFLLTAWLLFNNLYLESGHDVAAEYVKRLGVMTDNHLHVLVEKEVNAILRRCGLFAKMPHFCNSIHKDGGDKEMVETPLAEMENTSPATLSECLKALFGLILGSESSLPKFEHMQVPKLRSEACIRVARSLAEAYELIYEAIMDPKRMAIQTPCHWQGILLIR